MKIEAEKHIVELMIGLYCRKKEGNKELCEACKALISYAHARLSHCPYGDKKSSCKKCPIHCYKPEMREQIRQVMRWSGPRMILYHPLPAIRHLFS
ncbi:MAG: nitrous oxide-stimulated promoter family protein [Marinilabiliaceae bacterium]|nr:nitrous oxide-stimulated promoter family protein [Marinilabiliaceae bacterium]